MPLRLVLGLVKGLLLGGLLGYALAAAGLAAPSAWIAYPFAAVAGMLVALVAGKPIWAKDARIEVGMKAAAAAVLAPGLMWLARSFLAFDLPFDPSLLPGVSSASALSLGTFSLTSLALVAAVLGGFFEADNQPAPPDETKGGGSSKKRIQAQRPEVPLEADLESEAEELARRRA